MLHADAVSKGAMLQWSHWLDPDPELLERFDAAAVAAINDDWQNLEPQLT